MTRGKTVVSCTVPNFQDQDQHFVFQDQDWDWDIKTEVLRHLETKTSVSRTASLYSSNLSDPSILEKVAAVLLQITLFLLKWLQPLCRWSQDAVVKYWDAYYTLGLQSFKLEWISNYGAVEALWSYVIMSHSHHKFWVLQSINFYFSSTLQHWAQ